MTKDELTELDREVAELLGMVQISEYYWKDTNGHTILDGTLWKPTENRSQWAELLERFEIDIRRIRRLEDGYYEKGVCEWEAEVIYPNEDDPNYKWITEVGLTPGVAVVRATIALLRSERDEQIFYYG